MSTTLLVLRDRLQVILGDSSLTYAHLYTGAINDAIRETYPNLYEALENRTLVTGNILPNSHFEDWAATTKPDLYTAPTGSVAAATAVAYIRGGAKSAYLTAGATPDYFYITSKDYPRLLDLMGQTITFKCWAYPIDTADDASIEVYTIKADGTKQDTLISTTSNPKTAWTLLELENQVLNDDLVEIQFRFRVKTTAKHAYFDAARVTGLGIYEYLLPTDFRKGNVDEVFVQSSGLVDDLHPRNWERLYLSNPIIDDGTYKYLNTSPYLFSTCRQIRLIGRKPLDTMSADTEYINIDTEGQINLLLRYAAYLVYERQADIVGAQDIERYERAMAKQLVKYYEMLRIHSMPKAPKYVDRSLS